MDIQIGGLEFMPEPTKAYPGGELNPSPTKPKPGRFSGVDEKMNDFKKRKSEAGQDLPDIYRTYCPVIGHATDFECDQPK